MPDLWIVNSSPLIVLAKAGYLTLLLDPTREIVPNMFYSAYQGFNDRPLMEELGRLCNLVGGQCTARNFDHRADHVAQLRLLLFGYRAAGLQVLLQPVVGVLAQPVFR